jgi:hypothetical protein
MARILALLLGLATVAGAAYYVVRGNLGANGQTGASAPKETLDNVRSKAKQIEDDAQKRADGLLQKSGSE